MHEDVADLMEAVPTSMNSREKERVWGNCGRLWLSTGSRVGPGCRGWSVTKVARRDYLQKANGNVSKRTRAGSLAAGSWLLARSFEPRPNQAKCGVA